MTRKFARKPKKLLVRQKKAMKIHALANLRKLQNTSPTEEIKESLVDIEDQLKDIFSRF